MKAFIFSMLALIALCSIVVFNGIYISNITDDMSYHIDRISTLDDKAELDALLGTWEKGRLITTISVPHKESDELEKSLDILRVKIENKSNLELQEAICSVKRAIDEIKIHGTVSVDNVF